MFNGFGDDAAWRRTRAMAGRRGVDLARAVVEGWLQRGEVCGLLSTCATCGQDGLCLAATTPCPNWQALEALRA